MTRSRRGGVWLAGLLLAVGYGCGTEATDGTGEGPVEGEGGRGGSVEWTVAAERVRPSVHSVWGSRTVLEGSRTAFVPVGTAFAILAEGVLLTNAHVVAREDSTPVPRLHVLVQTDTGSTLHEARILALDMGRDLALVGVADSALVPVSWADRRAPMGASVATIGFGLPEGGIVDTTATEVTSRYTVFRRFSAGYSSGYRTLRPGDSSSNILEVDLFLFPGVSGGPTFGPDGGVLGVNRGHRRYLDGSPSSYGHVIPRLVVGQFLELQGGAVGADTARVFGVDVPDRDAS